MNFEVFFASGAAGNTPRPYQVKLSKDAWPGTLIIPTGFGKTAAILAAWLWRIAKRDPETPRRLAYCLPMRSLVEQTETVAKDWIAAAERAFPQLAPIHLDVLMGGRKNGQRIPDWMLNPERPAILIGTQDLLVSAALMRGYGVSRYRWPVDFALLHNDALWVFDEVQLMGAALPTSAQLEAFRRRFELGRGCRTLWMSATLDPQWLKTVDFTPAETGRPHDLSDDDLQQAEHLWRAVKRLKCLRISAPPVSRGNGLKQYADELAQQACALALPGTNTILFLNTVARAQAVFEALSKDSPAAEVILIHSRFRKAERDERMAALKRAPPPAGRLIVATQALEAGVDVTSARLFTELAAWSSLVQRFGRCNRYGECGGDGADVYWIDVPDTEAAPYTEEDFAEAREKLGVISDCGPADLAAIAPSAFRRGAVIRRRDLFDLYDTDPDLSGFDVDVSLYVRDADDTDVRLFWRPVDEGKEPPSDSAAPDRAELCPAPIGGAKQLLGRTNARAWVWDGRERTWRRFEKDNVFPGQTLWIDAASGGYDPLRGFDPAAKGRVEAVLVSDGAEDGYDGDPDARTGKVRVSLARHSLHVRGEMQALGAALSLAPGELTMLTEAALWHDIGKAHEAFVALTGGVLPPLAKWPREKDAQPSVGARRHFRHELASALAFLANREWNEEANLPAFLIAAHHGKVRMRLRALPKEEGPSGKLFARGVRDGDVLPATDLGALTVPETVLDLDVMQLGEGKNGSSWQARAQELLAKHGPFRLAWYEALLRIADWRASGTEEDAGHDDL